MRLNFDRRRVARLKRNHGWGPLRSSEQTNDVYDDDVLNPLGHFEMLDALRSNEPAANVQAPVADLQPNQHSGVFNRRPFA
jgi:hypothetical protein